MLQRIWKRTPRVLSLLIVATAGVVAASADVPDNRNPSAHRLEGDAARMYRLITSPHPAELKWQQIPWLTDLQEAMRQAKAERRPLLLFVSGDDPLEKC